ncbi:hypothetical protein EYA84_11200 [Verrucosispora sp. SN26_14.1]|nr:hypothetical protein EYA84_11200 [Verrucosispora sp. SN26_14.1]
MTAAAVIILHPLAAAPSSKGREMGSRDRRASASRGEEIEAAEREAAKQRILDLAEAERIPAEETTRVRRAGRGRRAE